jgi:glutathione S-transferase
MLRLLYAPLSPFARKVRVAAIETDVNSRITLVPVDVWSADPEVEAYAPLGQVPVLLGGPEPLPGSTLICEYLNSLNPGRKLVPASAEARWRVLASHALADGIMTAAVAHTIERVRRPAAAQWPQWLSRQESKIVRALSLLETKDLGVAPDLATITLGVALAYLNRRIPMLEWRATHPKLSAWLACFEQRPSMQMTRFPEEKAA